MISSGNRILSANKSIYRIYKSNDAPVPYPIRRCSEQNSHFYSEWFIQDMVQMSCGICGIHS